MWVYTVFRFLLKKACKMEADKENIQQVKLTTRIPLPVDPLPALPKHLLSKMNVDKREIKRKPLGTIGKHNENIACASSSQQSREHCLEKLVSKKKKRILKIDTKYVTVRPRNEYLDWDHNVFKDHDKNVISISDDDSDEKETKELKFVENKQNCFGESQLAVTPAVPIEHKGVKNIKKSLKRPHSRELQGLATATRQEKKEQEKVKRRLQFNEKLHERLLSPDHWKKSYMICLTRDYTEEMFDYLLTVERKPLNVPRTSNATRACIINWLMKVNGRDGNPAIIQSACWYFDSILGGGYVPVHKLQLIAAACYWIAQKLQGSVVPAAKLAKCSGFAFTASDLLATEMAVLKILKFPYQPIVPQEFITYLAWWCDQDHPGQIEVAATFLCMSGLMVDTTLCLEFPSVIAAAAVRNALLLLGKTELLNQLQLSPVFQAAEKKTSSLSYVSSILRRATRTIAAPAYEYDAPLEHYGGPPHYIAQTIINAAADTAVLDTRLVTRQDNAVFRCIHLF